ncbi:hypothetical protein J6590_105527 [Homalodisca vitripennis]|nr:hypothetical protein J6590_105527 [Homalodisca vitripennis]
MEDGAYKDSSAVSEMTTCGCLRGDHAERNGAYKDSSAVSEMTTCGCLRGDHAERSQQLTLFSRVLPFFNKYYQDLNLL